MATSVNDYHSHLKILEAFDTRFWWEYDPVQSAIEQAIREIKGV
jgi:hypothetical protein